VGLERGPLSLLSTIEELLESSGSGLENRDYGCRVSAVCESTVLDDAGSSTCHNSIGLQGPLRGIALLYFFT
jgi:hypothetical protein